MNEYVRGLLNSNDVGIEYEIYVDAIDIIEDRIADDHKYPVVQNNKIKKCCQITLEFTKVVINYIKINIDGTQKEKKH